MPYFVLIGTENWFGIVLGNNTILLDYDGSNLGNYGASLPNTPNTVIAECRPDITVYLTPKLAGRKAF